MRNCHINVSWSEGDDCYVADIPDLMACSALGSTPQEAVEEVLIAKEAWLEAARTRQADSGADVGTCDLSDGVVTLIAIPAPVAWSVRAGYADRP
jgi:predicted RNase H-like HicB family nuclease